MWLQSTSASERRVLLATYAGYGLDGFDLMIYSFIIPTLLTLWSMSKAQAGYIATGALVTSAIGGWAAGVLADRFGRARILQLTVLWFALFTFLSGFTHNFGELFLNRALQGFGFGGEWSVGSVLVAEIIDARHRGKATGLVQSSWAVGGSRLGVLGGEHHRAARSGLEDSVLARHPAGAARRLHPPQRGGTGDIYADAHAARARCGRRGHGGQSGAPRRFPGYFSPTAVAHNDTRHAVIDRNARRLLLDNDLVADLLG